MTTTTTGPSSIAGKTDALLDSAAQAADDAIHGAKRAGASSLDALSSGVESVRAQTSAALHGLAGGAEDLARGGAQALHSSTMQLRDSTAGFVRERPLQSVLIAAGAGAALVLLIRLLARSGNR